MNHSALINGVNDLMLTFIQQSTGTFEPVGPSYRTLAPEKVATDLVLHRMSKKWYVPNPSNDTERKLKTIAKWQDLEERISTFRFNPSLDEKWHCQRASMMLYKWLSPLRKNILSLTGEVEFTKGESFISSRGLTSVRQKLKCLKHWTVTYESADLAARMIWNNKALRYSAYAHLEDNFYDESAKYLWVQNSSDMDAFVFLVKTYLFRYVNGARMALVAKDNTIDRAINVEPTFNMLLQRMVGLHLRHLLSKLGNNLQEGQHVHYRRLVDKLLSTVDFSNASDSHILACFIEMFPRWFVDHILLIRSSMTEIKTLKQEVYNFKLSSMGNGFTFEVMTLLLLALARVNDPKASVYGDDVIVTNSSALAFVSACESLGWIVNREKTFIDSPFRESCGGFYHDSLGYLTSFDFHYCFNITDVITTANKLRILSVKTDVPGLSQLWKDVVDLCPSSLKGPILENTDTSGKLLVESRFIEHENFQKINRRNSLQVKRFSKSSRQREAVEACFHDEVVAIITGFREKPKVIKDLRFSRSNDTFDLYAAVYGLTADTKRNSNKSTPSTLYVTKTGNVLNLSTVRKCRAVS